MVELLIVHHPWACEEVTLSIDLPHAAMDAPRTKHGGWPLCLPSHLTMSLSSSTPQGRLACANAATRVLGFSACSVSRRGCCPLVVMVSEGRFLCAMANYGRFWPIRNSSRIPPPDGGVVECMKHFDVHASFSPDPYVLGNYLRILLAKITQSYSSTPVLANSAARSR